jgi:hypothetical protein
MTHSGKGYTHTLQARDEHDKKQWLSCLQMAMKEAKPIAAEVKERKTDVNCEIENVPVIDKMKVDTCTSSEEDTIDLDETCLLMDDERSENFALKRSSSGSSRSSLRSEVMEAVDAICARRRSLRSSTKSLASVLTRSGASTSSLPGRNQADGESVFEKSSDSTSSSEMDPLDFSKSKRV